MLKVPRRSLGNVTSRLATLVQYDEVDHHVSNLDTICNLHRLVTAH